MTGLDRLGAHLAGAFRLSPEGLALLRAYVAGALLAVGVPLAAARAARLGSLPPELHEPLPGILWPLPGFLPPVAVVALGGVFAAAAACLLVGWRVRPAAVAASLCLFVIDGSTYAAGKIDHAHLLLAWLPLVLSPAGWADVASVDARSGPPPRREADPAWPLALFALILGFGMASAGWPKLAGGWLDPATQASYGHTVKALVGGRDDWFGGPALVHLPRPAWEALDWATVWFELLFLPAALSRTATRLFCLAAVAFHWGVMLHTSIVFAGQLYVYAVFLPWDRIAASRPGRAALAALGHRAFPVAAALGTAGWIAAAGLAGARVPHLAVYVAAAVVAAAAAGEALARRARG